MPEELRAFNLAKPEGPGRNQESTKELLVDLWIPHCNGSVPLSEGFTYTESDLDAAQDCVIDICCALDVLQMQYDVLLDM